MPDADPNERIVIEHPEIEGRPVVTRRQLDQVWSEKGFVEVKGADADQPFIADDAQPAVLLPAPSLDEMTKPELLEHAESLGLDATTSSTKAEIIDMIQGG